MQHSSALGRLDGLEIEDHSNTHGLASIRKPTNETLCQFYD